MAGLSRIFKKHPWISWGLALFVIPAIIIGVTTTSRIKGTPEMVAYGNRRDALKQEAEQLGLIVDPAKHVAPKGSGPDGADLLRKAEAAWLASKQTREDRKRFLSAIQAFDASTWLDPGTFGDPYGSARLPFVAARIELIIEELLITQEFDEILAWVEALLIVAKPRQADSYTEWLRARCSAEDRALKAVLELAEIAEGNPERLGKLEKLLRAHPFEVDFRKEAASYPAHYIAMLDRGDFRKNKMFFQPCINALQTPDQCVMARTEWSVFRRAVEGFAYESWTVQMKNVDDLWKLAADADEIQVDFFNGSGRHDAFRQSSRIALSPLSHLTEWVTDLLIRERITLYILDALEYQAAHGRWPGREVPLPIDQWSGEPVQTRVDEEGRSFWSIGVDRANNYGAIQVYDDGGDSRQHDTRVDFPPTDRQVSHDLSTGKWQRQARPGDLMFRADGKPAGPR